MITAAGFCRASLDGVVDGDRYFLSPRIQTLKAIRADTRSERVREPSPLRQSNMHFHERRPRGDAVVDVFNNKLK